MSSLRLLGIALLCLGCGSESATARPLSMADALALARAEDEALNPMGDVLFEERALVELVRVPGHEGGVFHASFVTEIEGEAGVRERHYFVDATDGALLDASTLALLEL